MPIEIMRPAGAQGRAGHGHVFTDVQPPPPHEKVSNAKGNPLEGPGGFTFRGSTLARPKPNRRGPRDGVLPAKGSHRPTPTARGPHA